MKADEKALHFFLGVNSPQGFVSRFDQLAGTGDDWRTFLLKGGPGTGKSTILGKIAAHFGKSHSDMQIIHSSYEPDSLDAVILPGLKASIADGTSPHERVS